MNAHALDKVSDMARQARDRVGAALAKTVRDEASIQQQIKLLQQYRGEYQSALKQAMMGGIDTTLLSHYRQFLRSLDLALEAADDQRQQHQAKSLKHRADWMAQQRRVSTLDVLKQKQADQRQRQGALAEQRTQDDLTTAKYARNLSVKGTMQ